MKTRVIFNPLLQEEYDMPAVVDVEGATVGECLEDLARQFPESRDFIADNESVVRVLVSLNNQEAINLDAEGLGTKLNPGDEIYLIALIAGG